MGDVPQSFVIKRLKTIVVVTRFISDAVEVGDRVSPLRSRLWAFATFYKRPCLLIQHAPKLGLRLGKIMIELRVYCRQLFHSGVPRIVVKVQVNDRAEALLRELSAAEAPGILAKVETILKNASGAQAGS